MEIHVYHVKVIVCFFFFFFFCFIFCFVFFVVVVVVFFFCFGLFFLSNPSVVRRQSTFSNISSETTRPFLVIFHVNNKSVFRWSLSHDHDGCHALYMVKSLQMSRFVTKSTKWHVCPPKTQISLGFHPVWSIFAVRMKKDWVLSYPLSAQRKLIRLGGCPGWSESSLGAQSF